MLDIICLKGVLPTQTQRVNQIEREAVRDGEAERAREGERPICFERLFQVAISSVLIDNSP